MIKRFTKAIVNRILKQIMDLNGKLSMKVIILDSILTI